MKKKEKISELRRCAEIFEVHGHIYTSKWIRFLANNLEKNIPSDYHKDYLEILDSFKIEISKDEFSKKVHDEIEVILGTALSAQREIKFNKILVNIFPLIHNWRMTRENIGNIQKLFIKGEKPTSLERNYYLLLFIYMLEVEGSYDDIIRALYILALASRNRRIEYKKIFNKRLSEIGTEIEKLGYSNVLFRGWEDGHIRNAIAHARFSFEKESGKMKFIDIIPWSNKKVYEMKFSFQEFARKGRMVEVVSHIFASFIMLIRILDLVKYKWIRKD